MKERVTQQVQVPASVSANYQDNTIIIKGPKGENKKLFYNPQISIIIENATITLDCERATRREQRIIFTYLSHLKNMIAGVQQPFMYTLKICSSHFPMNVSIQGNTFTIKNFLGEKTPRTMTLPTTVNVKVQGTDVTVESCDLEDAGNTAGRIEALTKVRTRDRRVFQDGIYITTTGKTK